MSELDLTPRPIDDEVLRPRRRLLPTVVLCLVVAALGFVVVRTLGDAALFFYNADEAIERRDDLVDQRFRMQGTPFGDAVETTISEGNRSDLAVVFPIQFEGAVVDVIHQGSPAELFQPGVPVVLEGTWVRGLPNGVDAIAEGANDGWHFASSEMVVKHDNEYRNDNRTRLDEAEQGGTLVES